MRRPSQRVRYSQRGAEFRSNDQFVDIANRSQEAVTTAIHNWADNVQSFASSLTSGQSQLPNLQSVVDQYFDLAEKVLASQREFAQQWASATSRPPSP